MPKKNKFSRSEWEKIILWGFLLFFGLMTLTKSFLFLTDLRKKGHAAPQKINETEYYADRLEFLKKEQPDYVFIGNSMVSRRIDTETLSDLLGGKTVYKFQDGGSASVQWYLQYKNYLIASGTQPKKIFFFFLDDEWIDPFFRTTGRYKAQIAKQRKEEEPVLEKLFSSEKRPWRGQLYDFFTYGFQAGRRSSTFHNRLAYMTMNLLGIEDQRSFRKDINALFEEGGGYEVVTTGKSFKNSVDHSLLPAVIELAKENNHELVFVAVQKRPPEDGSPANSPQVQQNLVQFEAYVRERGFPFYDMSAYGITRDMYYDYAHIADTPSYTANIFYKHLKNEFE